MDRGCFSVTQVNRYIKQLMEEDALLCELKIEGELSNFKLHTSGHMYFTLKDASAAMNCVMFASYAAGLKSRNFEPKNGDKVIVSGHISLYEKTGQYQLYAVYMKPVGEGDLQAAFVRLRDKLKSEGLFEQKKPVPEWVNNIALVTSPTGAAVQDMIKVIRHRNPGVKIVVVPALVQGESAPGDIVRAIREVNEWNKADVMIVGRGGGSIEDLWAFNEEIVARAIVESKIPIISAVGHETDFTIADFAADLRAPTPSAAAVAAVPDSSEKFLKAEMLRKRADRVINQIYAAARYRFSLLDIEQLMTNRLRECKNTLDNRTKLLEKLSPYALWKRGYGAICHQDGTGVRSAKELNPGQEIVIHLQDGEVLTKVLEATLRAKA